MKQYKRATQKRLDLISVNEYTINEGDGQRRASRRKIKRPTLLNGRKDNGEGWNHPGGGGPEDRGQAVQHQQGDAREKCGEFGFFAEDCREHWAGCGNEDSAEKIEDAA
jgi:hypothetical protein